MGHRRARLPRVCGPLPAARWLAPPGRYRLCDDDGTVGSGPGPGLATVSIATGTRKLNRLVRMHKLLHTYLETSDLRGDHDAHVLTTELPSGALCGLITACRIGHEPLGQLPSPAAGRPLPVWAQSCSPWRWSAVRWSAAARPFHGWDPLTGQTCSRCCRIKATPSGRSDREVAQPP